MQLNKFLAHSGVSSRRNAVELIKQGLVKVNGEVVKEPGRVLLETDTVTVQGKKIEVERKLYIILNKPRGYITTTSDEQGRDTVMDLIGSSYKERLYPVGRLDRNTTGILLLTNDGELAQRLAHPKHQIQKVYHVTVNKPFTEVDRISHALGPKKNQLRITIHSGKYRVVRRLFEAVGYEVKKLDRVQYANMNKRGLPAGVWRKLQQKEVNYLKKAVGLE